MKSDLSPEQQALLEGARQFFADAHPLFGRLRFEPREVSRGSLTVSARFTDDFRRFEGEPEVHAGLLTIVLDSIMGFAVFTVVEDLRPVATINLRSDYIDAPAVGEEVICTAHCESVRDDVAHVGGEVRSSGGDLLARGSGAYMIGTRGPKFGLARSDAQ